MLTVSVRSATDGEQTLKRNAAGAEDLQVLCQANTATRGSAGRGLAA